MSRAVYSLLSSLLSVSSLALLAAASAGCLGELEPEPGDPESLGEVAQEVVYGVDNRQDVYAHADLSLRRTAQQAAVGLISPALMDETDPNRILFTGPTLGDSFHLCPGQRFASDVRAASCSGTLIDDDLVLTAGHCIDAIPCEAMRVVFNFYRDSAATMATVTADDVFSCASVVAYEHGYVGAQNLDYAIIKLDRPAAPRFTPAPVRQDRAALPVAKRVGIVGAPSSIPLKIDTGGKIRDGRAATLDYFVATTDSFGGNSGSGVFDLDDYRLAGILVRGENDYTWTGACYVVNTCTEAGCRGEDVTYVGPALDELCTAAPTNRLCQPRNSFAFTAIGTDFAQMNTTRQLVTLAPGQTITAATCGVPGAAGTGDTLLRLVSPSGVEVMLNDDADYPCGALSQLTYTVPPLLGGVYELRAGCFAGLPCSGNVAYTITGSRAGSFSFTANATDSATTNTVDFEVLMSAGQTLTLGTCGVAGATGSGNTYLRVFDPSNNQAASNDDACGTLSRTQVTSRDGGVHVIRAGCAGNTACSGTVAYTLSDGGSVLFNTTNTSNATENTVNYEITLAAGQSIQLGTCNVPGSNGTGDTLLRLFDPTKVEVALSDDDPAPGCGALSNIRYTAPVTGTYQLRAGCFAATPCSGTIAYTLTRNDGSAAYTYSASATASATANTADQVLVLDAGQTVKLGTCGLPGSAGTGNTYLRLFGPSSEEVASNDNACGGSLSNASFTVPADSAGTYTIRAGCSGATSCGGTVAFTVE